MYFLFVGRNSYPEGGWSDYAGEYATIGEAQATANVSDKGDWAHIVDVSTKGIVLEWSYGVGWTFKGESNGG